MELNQAIGRLNNDLLPLLALHPECLWCATVFHKGNYAQLLWQLHAFLLDLSVLSINVSAKHVCIWANE